MRVDFRQADWEGLAALWAEFFPKRYHVDAELLKQNTVGSPTFDWGASAIEVYDDEIIGFVAIKKSPHGRLYPGTQGDCYHLSAIAYKSAEVGIDLLSQAKRLLQHRGAYQLVFGTDSRHFFPGAPDDCPKINDFLMVEGFEKSGEHFDLERDLSDYQSPVEMTPGVEFRLCTSADHDSIKNFLDAEFPGRWTFDVLDKVGAEGAEKCVFGAFENGKMIGFALIQDSDCCQPIGGAVWNKDLGENWGSLGPIGVAKSVRGRGIGDSLLASALLCLKERGVKRCIIDWTTLKDFYGKHGFEITRTYRAASLKIGD